MMGLLSWDVYNVYHDLACMNLVQGIIPFATIDAACGQLTSLSLYIFCVLFDLRMAYISTVLMWSSEFMHLFSSAVEYQLSPDRYRVETTVVVADSAFKLILTLSET